jgi:hypothetical protein
VLKFYLIGLSFSGRSQVGLCRLFSTTSTMSKEQMEELQKNPYFEKYADKIAKLQK